MTHKSFKEISTHFWNSTSIRGIPRTVRSKSAGLRTFWGIATIICAGMLLWQVTALLLKYCSFIVAINAYDANVAPDFPYVTVCNLNPYDAFEEFEMTYEEYLSRLVTLRQKVAESSSIEFDNDDGFWSELQSKRAYVTNSGIFKGTPPMSANASFITDCTWFTWNWNPVANNPTGNLCKSSVTTRWAANFYRCYNIIPPMSNLMGFSAVFYLDNFPPFLVDSTDLNLGLTITEGLRLFIHAPSTYALVIQAGVNMSPGTEVTIRMEETKSSHLGEPYSSCTAQKLINPLDSYIYTQDACLTTCRQQQYIDNCHCAVAYEGYLSSQLEAINYTFCVQFILNPDNESDVIKQLQQLKCDNYFWPQNAFCDCKQACNEISYSQTVTTVAWPNPVNQLAFYDKYIKPYPEVYGTKFDDYKHLENQMSNLTTAEIVAAIEKLNLIPSNFMQLNVQMASEIQIINDDIPAVTWDTLLSDLGGTLNLWMGITVLFMAELVEVGFHILMLHCKKSELQGNSNDIDQSIDGNNKQLASRYETVPINGVKFDKEEKKESCLDKNP